jgi:hypothetical protein
MWLLLVDRGLQRRLATDFPSGHLSDIHLDRSLVAARAFLPFEPNE